jgi:hypothetical protein
MEVYENSRGFLIVGMMRGKVQHKRSVSLLVARAFVPRPTTTSHPSDYYDSVIHLDYNRKNNRFENLMWRPRWFVIKYWRQLNHDGPAVPFPIEDTRTGTVWEDSLQAAMELGLIDSDIAMAIHHRTYVWPTHQMFKIHSANDILDTRP